MRKKICLDSMAVQTVLVVVVGILCAVLAVSGVVISISEQIFINTYGRSQEQVFERIETELNNFHESIMRMEDEINSSWYLKIYLKDSLEDPRLSFQAAYNAKRDMDAALDANTRDVSFVMLSTNGKSYTNKAERVTTSVDEILGSEAVERALCHPETISYVYLEHGYTATTNDGPALMMVRALRSPGTGDPYGVILATVKETDFSSFYNYFASENSQFYVVDTTEKVVSSTEKDMLNKKFVQEAGSGYTILKRELSYYHFTMYGAIDNRKALGNLYNMPQLWMICGGIVTAAAVFIFFMARRITNPLSKLAEKMTNARNMQYDEHIVPEGAREVKELAMTYNTMLDELNRYIEALMQMQKEKRKAEILALQMQINPHYVYNTLAGIKWLIFQEDKEKATRALDAFIALLRSTIGDTGEYITVEKEIENLKNYALINNIRYGDKVKVEYFTAFGCEECKIPKMILQPFVENAFFHAFPENRKGRIQIFVRRTEGNLQIKIADDGTGMDRKRMEEIEKNGSRREHFTGIGINNVDARLKLLYGSEYGISIESTENVGTVITIEIPFEETT